MSTIDNIYDNWKKLCKKWFYLKSETYNKTELDNRIDIKLNSSDLEDFIDDLTNELSD